jgi:hypothetical protein
VGGDLRLAGLFDGVSDQLTELIAMEKRRNGVLLDGIFSMDFFFGCHVFLFFSFFPMEALGV